MRELQLYIEGQRVDLFDDETVSLTQTIQNVKDIEKVFTDFSKTFTLPASKTNNKIFKHYYNFNIIEGFDARIKKNANIELNNLPFTKGKIKLEGVDLKNNKPNSYRITFFGNTVELKELFGEDQLSALGGLTAFNEVYNIAGIKSGLQLDPTDSDNDVIVPLITHTDRLIYDSTTGDNKEGNVFYESGKYRGVKFDQLKYAIRLQTIIEAIEQQYSISFSNDFFVSTNAPFYNLFMWLHRTSGSVKSISGTSPTIMSGWDAPYAEDTNTRTIVKNSTTFEFLGNPSRYQNYTNELILSTDNNTDPYNISLQRNGIELFAFNNQTGSLTIDQFIFSGEYTVYIESNVNITFTNIQLSVQYNEGSEEFPSVKSKVYSTGTYNYVSEFTFDITQQIPEIKVIDFLTGLFRMFNLTAYVDNDTIVVKTLDSFYNSGGSYDITKYVSPDSNSVNVALPFREIKFQHEDTKTFLASQHSQLFGKDWGLIKYTAETNKLDGSIYTVKTPFSQLKYERLINISTDLNTTVQYGFFVNDNQESYFGKPLLFYPIRQTSSDAISFVEDESTHTALTTYNIPSNSVSLNSATSSFNMNFFNEANEYTGDSTFTNTLFESNYKNYIKSIFNEANRLSRFTVQLPLGILLNYTLADRFVISGNSYKINSITTNLQTGKSEIELLNDL